MWEEFQPLLDDYLIPMTYELPNPALDQMVEFQGTPTGTRLAEISELSMVEVIDEYGFEDTRVRLALLSFAAMWGIHLDEPLGFLYPLYLCRMMDGALVKGGSHRLSSAMYRSFLRDGGRVIDEYAVTQILTQDGQAVGVRLEDGREFKADAVISTLNPEQTFGQLLSADTVPPALAEAVERWEWEDRSLFGLHLGIAGKVTYKASTLATTRGQSGCTSRCRRPTMPAWPRRGTACCEPKPWCPTMKSGATKRRLSVTSALRCCSSTPTSRERSCCAARSHRWISSKS
jgi:phytoene dehydrogenase-like protein